MCVLISLCGLTTAGGPPTVSGETVNGCTAQPATSSSINP